MRKISAPAPVPARLLLAATLAALLALAAAPNAWAVIHHLRNGRSLSFQPLRGASAAAAAPLDAFFSNLDYNGGPVMPSNTNYAVYWAPSGASAYPSGYRTGIDTYFEDLAHDSGGHQNTDSVSSQYNDWEGDFARYESHFGGDLLDTDPYPANGCTKATICLTDEQLQQELAKFIEAKKLPTDLTHEYFLLTPPKVEDCFEAGGAECSAGSKAPKYCAYHSAFNAIAGVVVYANDPYVTGNFGCDDGNHPNGQPSDGALEGGLSHEHNESITDPEPNSGWTDLGSSTGGEIGDKCRTGVSASEFGTPLGTTGSGAKYNQVIDGHFYWYQQEWSNESHKCLQRWSREAVPATASFSSEAAGGANEMNFSAAGSSAPGGVTHYNWKFAGTAKPVETTVPTTTHKFPGSGKWEVALTVFSASGESAGTARLIQTGDEGPLAAFSPSAPSSEPGQSISFNAGESSDPDGSITAYEWNFGDGSTATGATPAHAYSAAGDYPVTLVVSDGSGQIATASHVVDVHGPPSAEFSFSPSVPVAGAAVAFNAGASSDPAGPITKYDWTFGDGGLGTGVAPEHAYSSPGTYTVTLTVTDGAGLHASVVHSVTVLEAPPPETPVGEGSAYLSGYSSEPGAAAALLTASAFTSTASVDSSSGAITLAASVARSGTLRWRATFSNGTFGVYAARASKCRKGLVRLKGRCRPATIVFSAGSETATTAGAVKLKLVPSASARRALASARARKHGLHVTVTVVFQPAQGGAPVTHTFSVLVRSARHR